MNDCLFCKMIDGEIDTEFIYEDDKIAVFKDINPQAPIHLLFIPKEHIISADDINKNNQEIIGHIFTRAAIIAKELDLENGYRIVNNCKEDGGQSVDHLHFHLLGGRKLMWPPG